MRHLDRGWASFHGNYNRTVLITGCLLGADCDDWSLTSQRLWKVKGQSGFRNQKVGLCWSCDVSLLLEWGVVSDGCLWLCEVVCLYISDLWLAADPRWDWFPPPVTHHGLAVQLMDSGMTSQWFQCGTFTTSLSIYWSLASAKNFCGYWKTSLQQRAARLCTAGWVYFDLKCRLSSQSSWKGCWLLQKKVLEYAQRHLWDDVRALQDWEREILYMNKIQDGSNYMLG